MLQVGLSTELGEGVGHLTGSEGFIQDQIQEPAVRIENKVKPIFHKFFVSRSIKKCYTHSNGHNLNPLRVYSQFDGNVRLSVFDYYTFH